MSFRSKKFLASELAIIACLFPLFATCYSAEAYAFSSIQQKAKAEGQKNSIEKKLSKLQTELSEKEAQTEVANKELQQADQAISQSNKKIRQLQEERKNVEKRLRELEKDGANVHKDLGEAEAIVSLIAKSQYLNLKQQTWQVYIDGHNPNRVSREKAQLKYLARAQTRAIQSLENEQQRIWKVASETASRKSELLRISQEERKSRSELYQEKQAQQRAINKLKKDIASHEQEIDKLKKDQSRLSNLVANLDKKIAQEKREQERKAQIAKAQNKKTEPIISNLPKGGFAKLKGKLTKPVNGKIIGTFGTKRSGSALWQGIRIPAKEGSEVKACAPGTVVFADWLRGYGNIIIVDHGNTYMSVYANNETTYKNVGEKVSQGETISTVGTSGGNTESGLYFEIRHQGKPINPTPWFKK